MAGQHDVGNRAELIRDDQRNGDLGECDLGYRGLGHGGLGYGGLDDGESGDPGGGTAALELAANEAWPAPDQEKLGGWLLRAADGWTGRANTALPVGDPGRPLDEAIEAVQKWYAQRVLPGRINVPMPLAAEVNALLDARGWRTNPVVLVQTTPLATLLGATAPATAARPAGLTPVRLSEAPSPALLDVVASRKGGLPEVAIRLLTAVSQVRFAEVYAETGDLLAIARGTVTGAGADTTTGAGTTTGVGTTTGAGTLTGVGTLTGADRVARAETVAGAAGPYFGIFLLEVVPSARRRGLARHMIGALTDWAGQLGAKTAFLQVEKHHTGAVALYERLGFTTHHHYLTRTAA